ncbi:uncharacterized protein LOC118197658 [Stegodyphus dumicola]|uniref:uncharacterized protein LOC118197658 n=1 Tax=Stegodyphus dumicola TaxID=202533 RepID=UPI0015B1BA43|nr:uncharacterized protein LOC118197658 [Stegodyphus dumicola]
MNDYTIKRQKSIQYLGIVIDECLTWLPHLDYIKSKVCKIMNNLLRLPGLPKPVLKELYKRAIERTIVYACPAWWYPPTVKMRNKTNSIQRIALLTMTKCYKTASTAALQVIAGIMPLHLKLDMESIIQRSKRGWTDFKFEDLEFTREQTEFPIHKWHSHPAHIQVFGWDNKPPINKGLEIYTDGLKSEDGTGAGFCSFINGVCHEQFMFQLDKTSTVYQAETLALKSALLWLKSHHSPAHIYSDSQAVLKSINKYDICNQNIIAINKLLAYTKAKLHWIRGHQGSIGDEKADELAKQGIYSNTHLECKIPMSYIIKMTKIKVSNIWQRNWNNEETGRHTFMLLPNVSEKRHLSDFFLNQIITNHGAFPIYINRFNLKDTTCKCQCGQESADALHMITECPSVSTKRREIFNQVVTLETLKRLIKNDKGRSLLANFMEYIYHNESELYL